MSNKVPYWVGVRQGSARSDSIHRHYEIEFQNRIAELEKENSELKYKLEKVENAFFIVMDLLMKKM